MVPDYPGGLNVLTRVLKSGRGRQKREPERWQPEKVSTCHRWLRKTRNVGASRSWNRVRNKSP